MKEIFLNYLIKKVRPSIFFSETLEKKKRGKRKEKNSSVDFLGNLTAFISQNYYYDGERNLVGGRFFLIRHVERDQMRFNAY